MYVHPAIEGIENARRTGKVTVVALAERSGIDRSKLTAVLNGLTDEEMRRLRRAARELGIKVPPAQK